LAAAKWLVEEKGALLIGGDTSGVEVGQDPALPGVANPVHEYLLVEQGVHIGEFHNLEELARDKLYRFTYVAMTNQGDSGRHGDAADRERIAVLP
jgi:kynurenine formamidase